MKTHPQNRIKHKGDGYIYDEAVVEFVKSKGRAGARIKDIANAIFAGDYRAAQNAVRRPYAGGRIKKKGNLQSPFVFCK